MLLFKSVFTTNKKGVPAMISIFNFGLWWGRITRCGGSPCWQLEHVDWPILIIDIDYIHQSVARNGSVLLEAGINKPNPALPPVLTLFTATAARLSQQTSPSFQEELYVFLAMHTMPSSSTAALTVVASEIRAQVLSFSESLGMQNATQKAAAKVRRWLSTS